MLVKVKIKTANINGSMYRQGDILDIPCNNYFTGLITRGIVAKLDKCEARKYKNGHCNKKCDKKPDCKKSYLEDMLENMCNSTCDDILNGRELEPIKVTLRPKKKKREETCGGYSIPCRWDGPCEEECGKSTAPWRALGGSRTTIGKCKPKVCEDPRKDSCEDPCKPKVCKESCHQHAHKVDKCGNGKTRMISHDCYKKKDICPKSTPKCASNKHQCSHEHDCNEDYKKRVRCVEKHQTTCDSRNTLTKPNIGFCGDPRECDDSCGAPCKITKKHDYVFSYPVGDESDLRLCLAMELDALNKIQNHGFKRSRCVKSSDRC